MTRLEEMIMEEGEKKGFQKGIFTFRTGRSGSAPLRVCTLDPMESEE